jgi:predicted  nucleic acid-binding Zn-ribbon protein
MGWMETLTKEAFFAAVREAVRPEFDALEKRLESEMKGVNGQIKGLEGEISGMKSQIESLQREINSNNNVLEGKIENIHTSVKSFFNETRADFYEKLYEKRIEVSKTPLPENTSEQ